MRCKINRNAAKELKKMLETPEAEGKLLRVYITEMHGNHAHYGISLETPQQHDKIVKTDKDSDVLLDTREDFLDGVWIRYFYVGDNPGFVITNPNKGGNIIH